MFATKAGCLVLAGSDMKHATKTAAQSIFLILVGVSSLYGILRLNRLVLAGPEPLSNLEGYDRQQAALSELRSKPGTCLLNTAKQWFCSDSTGRVFQFYTDGWAEVGLDAPLCSDLHPELRLKRKCYE